MCNMREKVVVVPDDQLDADWAACNSADGEHVVFVREGSVQLLDTYCAMGPGECPIWRTLMAVQAVAVA